LASKAHNFIVSSLVRKIRTDGFRIIYFEGKYQDVNVMSYNIPPKIINHRPDVIGEKEDKSFCIGEAKTKNDLMSSRTKKQFKDFSDLTTIGNGNKFYLGIPISASPKLRKLLDLLNLNSNKNIEVVYIPDEILKFENEI
jgi:hypothetical protein